MVAVAAMAATDGLPGHHGTRQKAKNSRRAMSRYVQVGA
jgi:hypothetical protein